MRSPAKFLLLVRRNFKRGRNDLRRNGAGSGSRTRVSSLGRIHNSRYTIPAQSNLEPKMGFEPTTPTLRKWCSSQLSYFGISRCNYSSYGIRSGPHTWVQFWMEAEHRIRSVYGNTWRSGAQAYAKNAPRVWAVVIGCRNRKLGPPRAVHYSSRLPHRLKSPKRR